MKYSIDRMHEPKPYNKRRLGKTVDAVADLIGKVMVTENETILLVVRFQDRKQYILREFKRLCIEHFNETPILKKHDEWGIEGYTSIIKIVTEHEYDKNHWSYRLETIPTFDLD